MAAGRRGSFGVWKSLGEVEGGNKEANDVHEQQTRDG